MVFNTFNPLETSLYSPPLRRKFIISCSLLTISRKHLGTNCRIWVYRSHISNIRRIWTAGGPDSPVMPLISSSYIFLKCKVTSLFPPHLYKSLKPTLLIHLHTIADAHFSTFQGIFSADDACTPIICYFELRRGSGWILSPFLLAKTEPLEDAPFELPLRFVSIIPNIFYFSFSLLQYGSCGLSIETISGFKYYELSVFLILNFKRALSRCSPRS